MTVLKDKSTSLDGFLDLRKGANKLDYLNNFENRYKNIDLMHVDFFENEF